MKRIKFNYLKWKRLYRYSESLFGLYDLNDAAGWLVGWMYAKIQNHRIIVVNEKTALYFILIIWERAQCTTIERFSSGIFIFQCDKHDGMPGISIWHKMNNIFHGIRKLQL